MPSTFQAAVWTHTPRAPRRQAPARCPGRARAAPALRRARGVVGTSPLLPCVAEPAFVALRAGRLTAAVSTEPTVLSDIADRFLQGEAAALLPESAAEIGMPSVPGPP